MWRPVSLSLHSPKPSAPVRLTATAERISCKTIRMFAHSRFHSFSLLDSHPAAQVTDAEHVKYHTRRLPLGIRHGEWTEKSCHLNERCSARHPRQPVSTVCVVTCFHIFVLPQVDLGRSRVDWYKSRPKIQKNITNCAHFASERKRLRFLEWRSLLGFGKASER